MKRAIQTIAVVVTLGLLLASCGGGSSNSNTPASGLSRRAFVSNSFSGTVSIVNYTNQALSTSTITAGTQPGIMAVTPDRSLTIVFDQVGNGLTLIENKTETAMTGPTLPAPVSSIAISTDSKTAWFATRNAPVTGAQSGAVQVVDLNTATLGTLGTQTPVPLAKTIVMSPDGAKLLAFSDGPVACASTGLCELSIVTTATSNVTQVVTGDVRPVTGVFSSDGTKAYIVNCGPECGGSGPAGVSVLDIASGSITSTFNGTDSTHPLVGSTAVLSGSNLYVAGSTVPVAGQSVGTGQLFVLNVNGGTVTLSKGPVTIGSGFHTQMALGADNKLFVGASGCPDGANVAGAGCLTIYDTSAGTATVTAGGAGSATGMAAVPNGHLVYVVMGGELLTFDTTTSAIFAGPCSNPAGRCFVDIVGQAVDVKIIDQ